MGALTLKSFPFILRDWDVKSYDSIDPTDSFGQDTNIYINKNQIIKIEPQFSNINSTIWLTDKGRQFFDSIFNSWDKNKNSTQPIMVKKKNPSYPLGDLAKLEIKYTKTEEQWETLFKTITKMIYIFDMCNFKNAYKYFFILIFENISLEILNLLFLLTQTHSFIKLRRAENLKTNIDFEASLQVNSGTCISKLSSSSLCLLIATDTRYEGSYLNLKLRQRYFKGSFKLLTIGSLKYLTFPIFFLGSNASILKTIAEGTNAACLDLVNSTNPLLITNTETLKRKDIQHTINIIKILKHTNIINNAWNGFNCLNSSLTETGVNNLASFSFLTFKDLLFFSSFYIINVKTDNIKNLKRITESRLLTLNTFFYNYKEKTVLENNKILITQDYNIISQNFEKFLIFKKYLYLPNNNFFENNETFLSTEGLIKKTTKLIFKNKTKSNWQLIRKFAVSTNTIFLINNIKDKKLIFFNNKNLSNFRNLISFQFYATRTLTNLSYFLNDKNKTFVMYKKFSSFKTGSVKFFKTKIKFWLDDFYTGGKDRFCNNSLTMVNCSQNLKLQTTNFL